MPSCAAGKSAAWTSFLLGTAPTGSPLLIIVRLLDDCYKIDTIGRRWHGCAETHKAAHGGMRLDRLPLGKGIWPFPCPVQRHKGTYPRKSIATDSAGGVSLGENPPALFENPEAPPHPDTLNPSALWASSRYPPPATPAGADESRRTGRTSIRRCSPALPCAGQKRDSAVPARCFRRWAVCPKTAGEALVRLSYAGPPFPAIKEARRFSAGTPPNKVSIAKKQRVWGR